MRRAVGAHRARPVQREAHRQALDRHVVHHLVVGALQERRVDRAERLHPLGRQARGEGHRVLLGDAHVEAALREPLAEAVQPGARRHRRGDRHDRGIALRLGDQRIGEHLGVGRRPRRRLRLLAGDHVELDTLCSLSAEASACA